MTVAASKIIYRSDQLSLVVIAHLNCRALISTPSLESEAVI